MRFVSHVPSLSEIPAPGRRRRRLVLGVLLLTGVVGCSSTESYPSRPIMLVCPWAQGGGTDRVSRIVAAHLEQELQTPVNVINATGGKGVTGHNRGLTASPDGYTITMATLELSTMHWLGLTSLTYEDCLPLYSLNEDYAALFVRADAPWKNVAELEQTIRDQPGTLKCSGTSTGGAWHLALAGWLIDSGLGAEAVTWISSTGSAPSLSELISGGLDMVCCSLPEADALLQAGEVRAIGVMSPKRAQGYDDIPTFAEQGTNWSLGGWRALVMPLETPPEIHALLSAAVQKILEGKTDVAGTTFPEFMKQAKFDHTYRNGEEVMQFLAETDRKLGALLQNEAMAVVRTDPFSPMIFPWTIGLLMGVVGVGLAVVSLRRRPIPIQPTIREPTTYNVPAMLAVVVAILGYWWFAETVGFVILSAVILLGLALMMGAPWRWAIAIAIVFPVLIYQLFSHGLRVPLPRGWLGW